MRFEVNVDDGNSLDTLHLARAQYNEALTGTAGFVPADDMPTYIQRIMDAGVAAAIKPFGPATLSGALAQIADLAAEKATLEQEVAATSVKAAPLLTL